MAARVVLFLAAIAVPIGGLVWMEGDRADRVSGKPRGGLDPPTLASLVLPPPRLEWAEKFLVDRCMARRGFRFPPFDVLHQLITSIEEPRTFRGLLSREFARARGYGTLIGLPGRGAERRLDPFLTEEWYLDTLSPEERNRYFVRLFGAEGAPIVSLEVPGIGEVNVPSLGCWARARTRIYGSIQAWLELAYVPQQALNSAGKVADDPGVEAARGSYSTCMKKKGYAVRDPRETLDLASDRFGMRLRGGNPTHLERALAILDAHCQSVAGYGHAVEEAIFHAAMGWVARHEAQLIHLDRVQEKALARASKILTGVTG